MAPRLLTGGFVMAERKPRIDKGMPRKGIHPIEIKTRILVKKQERAARKLLKGI